MVNYYLLDGSEISHDAFLRNQVCYGCGTQKDLQVHHCLFDDVKKHRKKIKQLQDVRNLMILCRHCHIDLRLFKGYDDRKEFWYRQCEIYGHEKMLEWLSSVPLIEKERYDLL